MVTDWYEEIVTTRLRPGYKFVYWVEPVDGGERREIAVTVVEGDADEVVSSAADALRMRLSVASAQALFDRLRAGGTEGDDAP